MVDDSPIMRRLVIRTLTIEGDYEFVEAGGASDAVKKLAKALPDLIVLDIGLGVESGFDLLSSLKNNKTTAEIPIIVCSASGDQATIEKSERLGASGYVPKPISTQALRGMVRKILDPHFEDEEEG